ncbi:NAD-dependent epimerase/dehydratase [Yersinia pseudotuberculosis]|nr:NAD-dependent epimerase/dehydratase family protein [Yersinia pseudotuberculosis]SUP86163.1 NAD-dependent epimerase/dehydratase [Yersinia pseudotuberculosis]
MNIMITGAAGFLGRRLIDGLLQQDYLTDQQGEPRNINKIIAYDVLPLMEVEDPRVQVICGDIADQNGLSAVWDRQIDTTCPCRGSRIMPLAKLEAARFGLPGLTTMVGIRRLRPSINPRRL